MFNNTLLNNITAGNASSGSLPGFGDSSAINSMAGFDASAGFAGFPTSMSQIPQFGQDSAQFSQISQIPQSTGFAGASGFSGGSQTPAFGGYFPGMGDATGATGLSGISGIGGMSTGMSQMPQMQQFGGSTFGGQSISGQGQTFGGTRSGLPPPARLQGLDAMIPSNMSSTLRGGLPAGVAQCMSVAGPQRACDVDFDRAGADSMRDLSCIVNDFQCLANDLSCAWGGFGDLYRAPAQERNCVTWTSFC